MPRIKTTERVRFDPQVRSDVYHRCACRCAHCGAHLSYSSDFTIEHVIPIAKGGTNDEANLIALCETCNKAKGDDIIRPVDYYKHLPKDRLEQVQALFDEYIHAVDFLDKDNLFLLDRFDLPTNNVVFVKQRKQLLIPTTSRVEKMRKEDAFQWLYERYIGRLCTGDKSLMANDPERLRDIYRCTTASGTDLFLFSIYVKRMEWSPQGPAGTKPDTERNTLCVDLYFNPEIKLRPNATIPTMYMHFMNIIQMVQKTFIRIAPCTAIECSIRSPHSDKTACEFFRFMSDQTKHGISGKFIEGEEADDAYCNGVCIMLFNATEKQGADFAKSHGHKSVHAMVDAEGPGKLTDPLDRALEKIQEQVPEKPAGPPPKQKPSDRKYRHKKKRHKN